MNEAASGRPIRFLGLVMIGWAAIRVVSQWGDPFGEISEDGGAGVFHPTAYSKNGPASVKRKGLSARRNIAAPKTEPARIVPTTHFPVPPAADLAMGSNAAAIPVPQAEGEIMETPPAPALPPTHSAGMGRWHGGAWLLWRNGSATRAEAATGGRLGGSQAGVRLDFDLAPHASGRITAYGRASAALNRPASLEGAMGLAWRPARSLPISFATERRIALGKGGRNANAVMAVGGFGPVQVAPSLEVETYAQGGMVGFRSRDRFVDAKMSLLSPVNHSPLRIGASLSGGAQPQVERLDIGPELQLRLPLQPVGARLGVEWRERIAGQAAPASGLAVTLGADF
ncbi:hypothetical protein Sphch_0122 [Sphingobium chlorophenolicum L-1]|uniref:Uncharacterized protein n=1 Tax=Sphingobium chlorophenolicum L-1 TaxID=690566 RepID=F6EU17_SPHCR|nr:hypothetical protein [Sphingobium chlorophenolicum]AEG47824.1 hypothetical protein Sphch_0122 [Sphingobium chlorophenolicum L-1]